MDNAKEYLILFIAPLLTFLTQFEAILVALTLLTVINYTQRVFIASKGLKGVFVIRLLKASFDKEVNNHFFKKILEYPIALTSIALFETYFIGGAYIEFLDGTITLSKLALLLVGWRELREIFDNIYSLTGNNLLTKIEGYLPEKLKLMYKKASD